MPRQKNDGRGRLGGRTAGTPNKDKPLKTFLREHSLLYFTPDPETGRSQYDLDMEALDPRDRIDAELKLLNYTTPKMQATTVDMAITDDKQTLSSRLAQLAEEEQ
ncbi:hypothetical protein EVA_21913 [gut metagenome]|uniref:Uncharacterized protein n=1 Tax=gut metagenome TaxID=749906 RepID=J9FRG6_9ZZZZ